VSPAPVGYAVLRFPASWLARGWVPAGLEGRWLEVPDPRAVGPGGRGGGKPRGEGEAVARPTGRLETRADGAVAEVWAVGE